MLNLIFESSGNWDELDVGLIGEYDITLQEGFKHLIREPVKEKGECLNVNISFFQGLLEFYISDKEGNAIELVPYVVKEVVLTKKED